MKRSIICMIVIVFALVGQAFADYKELFKQEKYVDAFNIIKPLAESGNADAQYYLGVLYDNGYGVLRDYAEAQKWYQKSAEQGHASAQFNLGYLFAHGQGVKQDYTQAAKWYQKAAAQGDSDALDNLLILIGKGVIDADASQEILIVQLKLKELDYEPGPIDGIMNPSLRIAIKEYQRYAGLNITGEFSRELMQILMEPCRKALINGRFYQQRGACSKPKEVAPGMMGIEVPPEGIRVGPMRIGQ